MGLCDPIVRPPAVIIEQAPKSSDNSLMNDTKIVSTCRIFILIYKERS